MTIRPSSGGSRIAITYRPVTSLAPDPANPRRHTKKQVEKIARSIEEFGFNAPILVDATLKVIAGHGRLLACAALGWTEVPTIQLDHLSDAQARTYMIADNRLGEISTWDNTLLAQQLKELSVIDLDFSIETTGFELGEIDLRIGGKKANAASDDPADLLPQAAEPPVSKPGDLWVLGHHRILCGNALEIERYQALFGEERAAMVFNGVPIDTDRAALTVAAACQNAAHYSRAGSIHFLCIDWRHIGDVLAAARGVYGDPQNLCVWAKDSSVAGSPYRSQHELVLVYKSGHAAQRKKVRPGRSSTNRSDLWLYPSANSLPNSSADGKSPAPTVKPVALIADAILDCSARRDIVLDGFLGRGTTLIAAERTGRRCFGLEANPANVDIAVRRWQSLTGKSAQHALTGAPYGEQILDGELRHAA